MLKRSTILNCVAVLLATSVADADDSKAKAYLKFWEPVVGTWEITAEKDGQPISMKWQLVPGTSGYALVSKIIEGKAREDAVHGYDPKEQCWKYVFITDMGFGIARCNVDFDKYPRLTRGVELKIETELTTWDGETTKSSATWQFQVVEKNQVVFVATNCLRNGEKQPDDKSTFKRIVK